MPTGVTFQFTFRDLRASLVSVCLKNLPRFQKGQSTNSDRDSASYRRDQYLRTIDSLPVGCTYSIEIGNRIKILMFLAPHDNSATGAVRLVLPRNLLLLAMCSRGAPRLCWPGSKVDSRGSAPKPTRQPFRLSSRTDSKPMWPPKRNSIRPFASSTLPSFVVISASRAGLAWATG